MSHNGDFENIGYTTNEKREEENTSSGLQNGGLELPAIQIDLDESGNKDDMKSPNGIDNPALQHSADNNFLQVGKKR